MVATYFNRGRGHSLNGIYAHSCGIYPLTVAVKNISTAIKPYYKLTQKTIKKWLEQIGPCEAHHVGKYAVLCDYYDTEGILDLLFDVTCNENTFIDELDCRAGWETWYKN